MWQKKFDTPLGSMTAASDGLAITGLWFNDQEHFGSTLPDATPTGDYPVFDQLAVWLTAYFDGAQPSVTFPVRPDGTSLRRQVWQVLRTIPYGEVWTYGEIADKVARQIGHNPGARAVGGAVGHNPISLVIPCHRVVGKNGDLTGYAGGLKRKQWLLELEGTAKMTH